MNHAFLILTHLAPEKINDHVKRLQAPNHHFFIHFDKKQNLNTEDPFYKELIAQPNVVLVQNRINVQWGSFRIVEATVVLMREALKTPGIAYFHLLSGECLHVKSIKHIHQYFEQHNGKEFLHYMEMPKTSPEHSFTYRRVDKYHLHNYFNPRSNKTGDRIIGAINTNLRRLQRGLKFIGIYRRYGDDMPKLYGGIAWWSLTNGATQYIIDYIDSRPDFYQRFKYVQLPDEVFFHTVLMNSVYAKKVVNHNVRYQDFTNATSNPNPLTTAHIKDLEQDNILFGRKFTKDSRELVAYLDKHVY